MTLLADRYALALRASVGEAANLERTADVLRVINELFVRNGEFRSAMVNPVLDKVQRQQLLDAVLKAQQAPPEVMQLLHTLLVRNRMAIVPALAARFETHINEWLNRVEVTVVTAAPLPRDLETQLMHSLEKFTGKTVQLKCKVDLNIVGGLIVYMWGVFLDFSLRTRLERLKQKLLAEEIATYGH
jgi:F-type H+-transporting ATPase subunit delta